MVKIMKLCHTVTLGKDRRLLHAVRPLTGLEEQSPTSLLAGPCKISFNSQRLAALTHISEPLGFDFLFIEPFRVTWSVLIIDDLERQPLFANRSPVQSLLMVGELIDGLYEGFQSFGHSLTSVTVDPITQHLVLSFEIAKDTQAKSAIGAAMCFVTIINSLLFVRGLGVASASLSMPEEWKLERPDFVNLYRYILTETYGH